MYSFSLLFLVLAVVLEVRLGSWNDNGRNGKCYNTHLITNETATHPGADRTYVGITAAWLLTSLFAAILSTRKTAMVILYLALLQFPLHLYMVVALRTANQDMLEGGDENDWDFG